MNTLEIINEAFTQIRNKEYQDERLQARVEVILTSVYEYLTTNNQDRTLSSVDCYYNYIERKAKQGYAGSNLV